VSDGLPHDRDWTFVETIEVPDGADHKAMRDDFMRRHPEFSTLDDDWFRIDLMCGRGGRSALRFWVRTSPPPAPKERFLP
jgi:hypothetical protein